jgi:Na+-driven multidrug efflux pump
MSTSNQTTPPTAEASPAFASTGPQRHAGGMREVLLLAYPVVLQQISMTTMGIVDSAMVGTIGPTELGAVGFGGIWLWTFMCFFVGTTSGVQTFVAQKEGAGALRECGAWAWQGIYAVLPFGLAASAILYFGASEGIRLLGPSEQLQPLASTYVSVRSLGMTGMLCATAFSAFFRGVGDTRTPLYATLAANGLNVFLDYGLIFGEFGMPRLEVQGAAIATVLSEWLYMVAMIVPFLRPRVRRRYATEVRGPRGADIRRLLRVGAPIGGQWWLEMISFAAFTTLVARMGDASMAASRTIVRSARPSLRNTRDCNLSDHLFERLSIRSKSTGNCHVTNSSKSNRLSENFFTVLRLQKFRVGHQHAVSLKYFTFVGEINRRELDVLFEYVLPNIELSPVR